MVELIISGCECLARDAKAWIEAYPHGGGSPNTEDPRLEALDAFLWGVENDDLSMIARGVQNMLDIGYHLSVPWEAGKAAGFEWEGWSARGFLLHEANPIGPNYARLTDIASFDVSSCLRSVLIQMCRVSYRQVPTPVS